MWSPTHIQVTVLQAKGLLTKGKNDTNNCFVTIGLGKEKYQTSVKEKATTNVDWKEECELKIPDKGNRAELALTCLHRNNLGIDEFLGQVTLPLNEMDVYDVPRSKWFKLESKPGKEKKNKERGELEVRISFVVKSGSLADLSKKDKHKSSIGQLASSVGGSLLSIGTLEKRKGIKNFAKSVGSKMHLHSKKKNKDGDDVSFSGSFASIGTPNISNGSNSRRFGQRAGEADPGVISEDEDEFAFDNLSHKSSGSSLNIVRSGLQQPTQNPISRKPLLLLGNNGKAGGKQHISKNEVEEEVIDLDNGLDIGNDFSVRTQTLPAPSKPPRTAQLTEVGFSSSHKLIETNDPVSSLNEWESKLYGKHLDVGSSDSLKRRSWELSRVPLPKAIEGIESNDAEIISDNDSSTTEEDDVVLEHQVENTLTPQVLPEESHDMILKGLPKVPTHINIISPEEEKIDINHVVSAQNSAPSPETRKAQFVVNKKDFSQDFIDKEAQQSMESPAPMQPPTLYTDYNFEMDSTEKEKQKRQIESEAELKLQQKQRAEEDARLEEELRLNEKRLFEEEQALNEELHQQEDQKRREAKRQEEDQQILNFAKRSTTEEDEHKIFMPESPIERPVDNKSKRIGKFKYTNNRDKSNEDGRSISNSPKSNERIIIGHEKSTTHAERRSETSVALAKKYEGKSREELMLIANGMENEALLQRQRVKELEDYLDNLLLRVMETHPKILQKPYARTTSAKSFKNYINMNDFL